MYRGIVAYLKVGVQIQFRVYPYWGYKIHSLGYICYNEGNLIIIEKCYS